MSPSNNFLILVGSFARGDAHRKSDIDFVEIGRPNASDRLAGLPQNRKINIIHYSPARFRQLYDKGDLFIYHVLMEGILKAGNKRSWERLRRNFRVRKSFRREIRKNTKTIDFLLSDRDNLNAPVAFLANFFRAMKQTAIFRLAERQQYLFSKKDAILAVFPWVTEAIVDGMLSAEYILMRKFNEDSSRADLRRLTKCANELFHLAETHRKEFA